MAKSQKRYLVLLVFGLLVIIAAGVWMVFGRKTQIYEKTEEIFGNPLMGYAPCAWEETIGEDISLLYMDITWAELEPEEGKYDWEKIERENQTDRWREEGKHLVLRFVCDIPGEEKHMDIPQWLYDKTDHAGTWYDMFYPQLGVKLCSMAGGGVQKSIWCFLENRPGGTGQAVTCSTSGMGLRLK